MNLDELIRKLFSKLCEMGSVTTYSNKLEVSSETTKKSWTQKEFEVNLKKIAVNFTEFLPLLTHDIKEIFTELKAMARENEAHEKFSKVALSHKDFKQITMEDFKRFLVCYSIKDDNHILVDPKHRRIVHDNANPYFLRLDGPEKAAIVRKAPEVNVVYDPHMTQNLGRSKENSFGIGIEEVTSYEPPKWRSLGVNENCNILPQIWQEFFEHLFPIQADREYVYTWTHYLLTSRNQTFLYLTGAQGTGKTTFASDLLGALVGMKNYHVAKSDFATSRFNGFLDRKQLIILDEFKCNTSNEKNVLKQVINDVVSVESKGVDQYNIENKCSFIIINNVSSMVRIEPFDRRFSIPELTDNNILKSKGTGWLKTLKSTLLDPEVVKSLASFFINWKPKHSTHNPYKTEYFNDIVRKSSSPVYRFLIDYFAKRKTAKVMHTQVIDDFYDQASKYEKPKNFPSADEIYFFFSSYDHYGTRLLKDIEYIGDEINYLLEENKVGIDD